MSSIQNIDHTDSSSNGHESEATLHNQFNMNWPSVTAAIQWHIKFKLASLTFKAMHAETSPYLDRLLTLSRVLGSSSTSNLL